ncbi:MAG TPA: GcrA family cell cycle regulator, partial [Roseiarcus sp.]|nr:GcrA family cell cycle regulator [Roseiarcus sp.]
MAWTDEIVEQLKQHWMDGKSASQIASLLGNGLTRNAIIGKVHRLGLAGRART